MSLLLIIIGSVHWAKSDSGAISGIGVWFYSMAQTWILWFPQLLCVQFIPSEWCASSLGFTNKYTLGMIFECFFGTIGQWFHERETAFKIIEEKVAKYGEEHYFMPEELRAGAGAAEKKPGPDTEEDP
jgi:hypothetical protein